MPTTATPSPAPLRRWAAHSTSAPRWARLAPTASSSSRPVRSRAAMRSSSSCFHRARSSTLSPCSDSGWWRSASTPRAPASAPNRRVRKRLAAVTATNADRRSVSPARRSRRSGWWVATWSMARRTAPGSADRSTASVSSTLATVTSLASVARIRIAACQINTFVGDLDGNANRIVDALQEAERAGADIAVFPELAITGYPPEDLLLKPGFVADNLEAMEKVASQTEGCAAVFGFVDADRDLRNAAAICANGRLMGTYHKRYLPNYAVFDEQRYFAPGTTQIQLYLIGGVRVGVSVCEDAWSPTGPIAEHAAGGAELVVNINASPYYKGRLAERERMLATRAADASCSLVYVNQVGGQDELVFDGASMVLDSSGNVLASAPQFAEHIMIVDIEV